MDKPLVDKLFLVEKYPGKGGWTFVAVDGIPKENKAPFGWVKVKGTIDGFAISDYKLMPMSDGKFFLPLRAEIRKKIGKKEGDMVLITLYKDDSVFVVPDEFLICLKEEPNAYNFFNTLSESEQRLYVVWIYEAKREETKANRILKSIEKLLRHKKLYEKEDNEY
jgi:bifunctional DNA-binding transcriptional regulator/antitoxin component of YhaV-PrlF toxin-antitoxin module